MTKELSKQLYELCGVEPRFKLNGKGTHIHSQAQINEFPEEFKERTKNNWVEVYPDFGQPENFVKLQELMCDCGMGYNIQLMDISPTLLQIDFCWDEGFDFYIKGNTFQEVYLRFCEQICALDEDGNIKQSIREAEWKYE